MSHVSHEPVALRRDVVAMQIPSGSAAALRAGTVVRLTQSLGGSYTVDVPSWGGLFRIAGKDGDALGIEGAAATGDVLTESLGSVEDVERAAWDQLRTVYDPEIPINIVELGLIYDLRVSELPKEKYRLEVKMTLTAPGCGMGAAIADDAKRKLSSLPAVSEADVQLVWDPQWNQTMMSEAARLTLGL